ncbi:hypothetical protein ACFL6U_04850, partial [Planctomycetota bacterium]
YLYDVSPRDRAVAFGKSKTRYFDGLVGEVRIYDQALDMNEQMSLKDELVKKWDVTSSDF